MTVPQTPSTVTRGVKTIADGQGRPDHGTQAKDYPVLEYIGAMARELAQMARWDGDEHLARLLDDTGDRAERSERD